MVFPKHNKHHLIVSTNYIASQAVFVFLIFACFLYVCINQEIIRDMDFSFLWIFSEKTKTKGRTTCNTSGSIMDVTEMLYPNVIICIR